MLVSLIFCTLGLVRLPAAETLIFACGSLFGLFFHLTALETLLEPWISQELVSK